MKRRRWLLGAGALTLAAALFWIWSLPEVRSFDDVVESHQRSDRVLLDRHGEIIQEIRTDLEGRRLEWVPLSEVSPRLVQLLVFSEDRDFFSHSGVDWGALAASAWDTLVAGRRRGASTLTMQLAAQLDGTLQAEAVHRSLFQKWRQLRAAIALERSWTKSQILEAYLNLVSFRGELQGISAASRGLFGKQPHGLDFSEVLILVALLRSPNARSEAVIRRAEGLAKGFAADLDAGLVEKRALEALGRPYQVSRRADLAPHLARRVLADSNRSRDGAFRLQVSLDRDLQSFALAQLQEQLRRLSSQNVKDGAVLAVDNRSGEVLVYVANGGELSSAVYVDGVEARRQAGSTLKPFLYALALERRLITPASPINDEPLNLAVSGGVYRPSNYDNVFRGLVSARVALASSLNVPAVRLLQLVGEESFVSKLRDLGFQELQSAGYYGPSLALGTADISLWELVNAYRTLANLGSWSPLTTIPVQPAATDSAVSLPAARRAFTQESAFLVSDILSDRESRSSTFGLENALATSYWSAVKTGTSKDMRDNWCVGYSSEVTVGVWIGNFSGEPMWNVSGISGAAPLWLELMGRLHASRGSSPPSPPAGVVPLEVADAAGETVGHEWFQEGTEETRPQAVASEAAARILYPPHQAVLALDPDIPPGRQRVFFESSASQGLSWRLDGKILGPATFTPWKPVAGVHRLELVDGQGRHLDGVQFSVRGAGTE